MRAVLSRGCLLVLLVLSPLSALAASLTATVAFLQGNGQILSAGGRAKALQVGTAVVEGDAVRLMDKTSRVVLKVSDGTELRLKGKTEMRFKQFNQNASGTRRTQLELAWGSFWAKVAKLTTKRSRFEVKAGGVVCGVRGTIIGGWYDPDSGEGAFYNFEGDVFVNDGQGPRDLPQGTGQGFNNQGFGDQNPNRPEDSNQFDFGDGGPVRGDDDGQGGGLLGDLSGDLGDALGDTRDDDKKGGVVSRDHADLSIQFDTPEGNGGVGYIK